jgi:hypothetical protein
MNLNFDINIYLKGDKIRERKKLILSTPECTSYYQCIVKYKDYPTQGIKALQTIYVCGVKDQSMSK